jgi:hypothetical protein
MVKAPGILGGGFFLCIAGIGLLIQRSPSAAAPAHSPLQELSPAAIL